jgi:hypothetical protein
MIVASRAGGAPTGRVLPAVYLVPVAYWLQDVQFCASVHCQVDGTKAIGILAGSIEGQLELDFGDGMQRFPARTAEQWRVDDAAEAEKHRNEYAAARRIEDIEGGTSVVNNNNAEPQGRNDASSGTRAAAAPARSAEARGDDRRETYGSTQARVRGRARTTTTAPPPVWTLLREPLPFELPQPVVAPVFKRGLLKEWVEQRKRAIRDWTRRSLAGIGLARHVPVEGADIPSDDVRDALHVTTKGLVAELSAVLARHAAAFVSWARVISRREAAVALAHGRHGAGTPRYRPR